VSAARPILLVLADATDRALAALLLGQALPGHTVVEIADAVAYAEAFLTGPPAAVIAGLRLSWADGLDLLAAARRRDPRTALVLFDRDAGEPLAARLPEVLVDRYVERSSAGFLALPEAVRAAIDRAAAGPPAEAEDPVWRHLVAAAPIGLFSAAADGTLRRVNRALAGLLGRGHPDELVGRSLADLLTGAEPPVDWAALRSGCTGAAVAAVVAEGDPAGRIAVCVWTVTDAAGRVEGLEGAMQPLPAAPPEPATGEPARAAGAQFSDVEDLLYAVSHDLQEPLNVIARHALLLGERLGPRLDPEATRYLGHLSGSAGRMQVMIDGLLHYARTGREYTPLGPVDFNRALEEALANLRVLIEESGAEVRHTPLPTLTADHGLVVELFQNLVANGIKFRAAAPPRVIVGVRERESDWRFAVKDNGIGIDPRFHQRIFGMFQRLHTAEEYPGTGVGLALCRRIVQRHGGEIWVHSAPGEGSTFYFTIAKQPPATVAPETIG
jgi:signal transduction histidine kinase